MEDVQIELFIRDGIRTLLWLKSEAYMHRSYFEPESSLHVLNAYAPDFQDGDGEEG